MGFFRLIKEIRRLRRPALFKAGSGPLNPFELHVRLLITAIASWRPYLIHVNEIIYGIVSRMEIRLHVLNDRPSADTSTFCGKYEDETTKNEAYLLNIEHFRILTETENEITERLLCLDSTLDTVTSVANLYRRMSSKLGSVRRKSNDDILFALEEQERDGKYTQEKAELLLFKARSTREAVGIPLVLFDLSCLCCQS